jgi:hypothetical protein
MAVFQPVLRCHQLVLWYRSLSNIIVTLGHSNCLSTDFQLHSLHIQ